MNSVLICTYNRGELIQGTLKSLLEDQTIPPDEIVVVNGGGERDCTPCLEKWKSRYNSIRIVNTANINLATSRNLGLSHCRGNLILLTDDDARPFPDWVEKIGEAHEKYPDAGVIGGNVVETLDSSLLDRIAGLVTFPGYKEIREVRSVPGVNSSYKKQVISDLGPYDESLERGEDVDYNWRARSAGWKVLHIPGIKVIHIHRPSLSELIRQHYMYGRSYYRVRSKWPSMHCTYPRNFRRWTEWAKLAIFIVKPFYHGLTKAHMPARSFLQIPVSFLYIVLIYYSWMWGVLRERIHAHKKTR